MNNSPESSSALLDQDGNAIEVMVKNRRITTILSLILAVVLSIGLWLYVVSENNTVNAVSVTVIGNERLMSNNYSVSDVEPSTVDVVLRGKAETIKQITADKSLVGMSVNIFRSAQYEGSRDGYIFEDESQIKPGEYTVTLQAKLPDGVTCTSKTVKVTISESSSRVFSADDVIKNITNYSFAENCSLASIYLEQSELIVSGDINSVQSIATVAVSSDWSKEISGDVAISGLVPVAYDSMGDVIDSRFLRFEPEVLQLNISVNKTKEIFFSLSEDVMDTDFYTLSEKSVTVIGPVRLTNKLGNTFVLNADESGKGDKTIADVYVVNSDQIARSVSGGASYAEDLHFIGLDGKIFDELTVKVSAAEGRKTAVLKIPADQWICLTDGLYDAEILTKNYEIEISYVENGSGVPSVGNLLCVVDLRGKGEGSITVEPKIGLTATADFKDLQILKTPELEISLVSSAQPTETYETVEPTPTASDVSTQE